MEHVLENSVLRVTVDAAAGGKITGLQDLRTGRQWLWRNPYLAASAQPYGVSYVELLDTGGWDEIFPSVAPCEAAGFSIPDHGDLVSLPWEVLSASAEELVMAVTTRFADCRFTRTLRLEGDAVIVEYEVENRADEAVPYLWCAHPLVAIEEGMEIGLPEGTPMRVDGGVGVPQGAEFSWPRLEGLPALDSIGGSASFAIKMFTSKGAVDEVRLTTADRREQLCVSWDREEAPYLGMWLNCRGWSGSGSPSYFNLGLEPTTAPFDSLADALQAGSARWIAAGETRKWGMVVRCVAL